MSMIGVLILDFLQERARTGIVGFAVEGEFQIIGDVVVARIDQRVVRQFGELVRERVV